MEPQTLEELKEYLLSWRVLKDGHWIHPCRVTTSGYSTTRYQGKTYYVHRLSAHIFHGLDLTDKEQQACHKTECKEKKCWNPEHIYLGNHFLNQQDNITKGKHPSVYNANKTHCKYGHEYTKENTYKHGNNLRGCRKCRSRRSKEQNNRRKKKKDVIIIPPLEY